MASRALPFSSTIVRFNCYFTKQSTCTNNAIQTLELPKCTGFTLEQASTPIQLVSRAWLTNCPTAAHLSCRRLNKIPMSMLLASGCSKFPVPRWICLFRLQTPSLYLCLLEHLSQHPSRRLSRPLLLLPCLLLLKLQPQHLSQYQFHLLWEHLSQPPSQHLFRPQWQSLHRAAASAVQSQLHRLSTPCSWTILWLRQQICLVLSRSHIRPIHGTRICGSTKETCP